ncbi:helix-turn-helix domain-containing protein [Tenacibaculum haliotis]|uniref:helix-turn-helix domain-containing protein n=1 Tax=Tenacibaculum haliotis TaxID=1888914 RepID=UPI0021AFC7F7|nr:helix-turn-helix domain-containing protein [Tenacibaculum haliotis]MCT4697695.1 helix-turn-helix domain-containing protein [Tenacibaculum haliotis]
MEKKKGLEFYKLFHPLAEDNRLTDLEKIVAMYIFTLHSFNMKCFASNKYMASVLKVSSSGVDTAIKKLQYVGYIEDLRSEPSVKHLKICATNVTNANFYKFYKVLLVSKLKYSTKFLLTYILSYTNSNRRFYDTNANILRKIGLGKEAVATAKRELRVQGWITIKNPRSKWREFLITANRNPIGELTAIEAKKVAATLRPETSVTKPDNGITSPKLSVDSPKVGRNKIINNKIKKENSNNRIYNNISENMVTASQLETFLDLDYSFNFYDIPIESLDILESSTSVNADQLEVYLDAGLTLDEWLALNISPTAGNSSEEILETNNLPINVSVKDNNTEAVEAETITTKVAEATEKSVAESLAEAVTMNKIFTKEGQPILEVLTYIKRNDTVSVTDFLMQLYFEVGADLNVANIVSIQHHINQSYCSVAIIIKGLTRIYKENLYINKRYKDVEVPRSMLVYLSDIYK